MIDLFLKGGLLMYPLAACSLVSLAIIIEKAIQFWRARSDRAQVEGVLQAAGARDWVRAEQLAQQGARPLARFLAAALAGRQLPRATLEGRLSRQGSLELKRLSHRLHLLELIGRISPMLGLTGTVTGLTRAFQTVAALRQVSDPSLLASGIWEALITTVFGLSIAIPCVFAYNYFVNRIQDLVLDLEDASNDLIENFSA